MKKIYKRIIGYTILVVTLPSIGIFFDWLSSDGTHTQLGIGCTIVVFILLIIGFVKLISWLLDLK